MNKVTAKDIAREAGVSEATVSYILNDRKDQKISEKTRKKVLQIANIWQYRPSVAAKNLATGKSSVIGIMFADRSPTADGERFRLVQALSDEFFAQGYELALLPLSCAQTTNMHVDAIICVGFSRAQFEAIGNLYFIPLICVDMIINHFLFFQVYSDYGAAVEQLKAAYGEVALIFRPTQNAEFDRRFTEKCAAVCPYETLEKTKAFIRENAGRHFAVTGQTLAERLATLLNGESFTAIAEGGGEGLPCDAVVIDSKKKAAKICEITLYAVNHVQGLEHDHPVKP